MRIHSPSPNTTLIRELAGLERVGYAESLPRDPRIASGTDYGNPDPEWLRIDWRQHLRRVQLPGARSLTSRSARASR